MSRISLSFFTSLLAVVGSLIAVTPCRAEGPYRFLKEIPVSGQHEVIGMSGDIALYQGRPAVHTHMVVGNPDGTTLGGHVLAAHVSPTLEVIVTEDPVTIQKRFDPATSLTLIDPAAN